MFSLYIIQCQTVADIFCGTHDRVWWYMNVQYYLAPGRLDVPVSMGTPTNAASSPSAVFWNGNLHIVAIPLTLATNSALGGTLKPVPDIRRVQDTLLWSPSKCPCFTTLWEAHALKIWEPPKTARVLLTSLIEESMISLAWNQLLCKQPSLEVRFNGKVSQTCKRKVLYVAISSGDSKWTFSHGVMRGWTLCCFSQSYPLLHLLGMGI